MSLTLVPFPYASFMREKLLVFLISECLATPFSGETVVVVAGGVVVCVGGQVGVGGHVDVVGHVEVGGQVGHVAGD